MADELSTKPSRTRGQHLDLEFPEFPTEFKWIENDYVEAIFANHALARQFRQLSAHRYACHADQASELLDREARVQADMATIVDIVAVSIDEVVEKNYRPLPSA